MAESWNRGGYEKSMIFWKWGPPCTTMFRFSYILMPFWLIFWAKTRISNNFLSKCGTVELIFGLFMALKRIFEDSRLAETRRHCPK